MLPELRTNGSGSAPLGGSHPLAVQCAATAGLLGHRPGPRHCGYYVDDHFVPHAKARPPNKGWQS